MDKSYEHADVFIQACKPAGRGLFQVCAGFQEIILHNIWMYLRAVLITPGEYTHLIAIINKAGDLVENERLRQDRKGIEEECNFHELKND